MSDGDGGESVSWDALGFGEESDDEDSPEQQDTTDSATSESVSDSGEYSGDVQEDADTNKHQLDDPVASKGADADIDGQKNGDGSTVEPRPNSMPDVDFDGFENVGSGDVITDGHHLGTADEQPAEETESPTNELDVALEDTTEPDDDEPKQSNSDGESTIEINQSHSTTGSPSGDISGSKTTDASESDDQSIDDLISGPHDTGRSITPDQNKPTGDNGDKESLQEETETRNQEPPDSSLELFRRVDDFLDKIDGELELEKERKRAGEQYRVQDRFGESKSTQSSLGFDYVRNDGIIVNEDEGEYWGILHVKPVRWMTKSDEEKRNTLSAYIAFLKGLQWGVSIPCYPRSFDLTVYLGAIQEAGALENSRNRNPVLDYGRRYHIEWVANKIDPDGIKRKEHYLITRATEQQAKKMANPGGSAIGEVISDAKDWVSSIGDNDDLNDHRIACIQEIRQRQMHMKQNITRAEVEVDVIDERQEVMEIAYFYFHHIKPLINDFDFGGVTKADFSNLGI